MALWQFRLLAQYAPALEADESLGLAPLSILGEMRKEDRRRYLRDLERQARPLRAFPPAPAPELVEYNPEKAAEWFAQRGYEVANG